MSLLCSALPQKLRANPEVRQTGRWSADWQQKEPKRKKQSALALQGQGKGSRRSTLPGIHYSLHTPLTGTSPSPGARTGQWCSATHVPPITQQEGCTFEGRATATDAPPAQVSRTRPYPVSDTFFSRFATFFSRFYLRSLEYSYVFSDPNIHFRTEVCSYPKNVPTVFKNRSFRGVEPPERLEILPDILTQKFLEIRLLTSTGAGSDQPCSAWLCRA
jgi:hypothetical protein